MKVLPGLSRGILAGALLLAVLACPRTDDNGNCNTQLDYESGGSVHSPAPGVLTFTGQFFSTETVILGYTDDGGAPHSVPITPATARTSLSFAGLPSGTRTYTIKISCSTGQEDRKTGSFTVS